MKYLFLFFIIFLLGVCVFLINIISLLPACKVWGSRPFYVLKRQSYSIQTSSTFGDGTLKNFLWKVSSQFKCQWPQHALWDTPLRPSLDTTPSIWTLSGLMRFSFFSKKWCCPTGRIPWDYLNLLRGLNKGSNSHALDLVLTPGHAFVLILPLKLVPILRIFCRLQRLTKQMIAPFHHSNPTISTLSVLFQFCLQMSQSYLLSPLSCIWWNVLSNK